MLKVERFASLCVYNDDNPNKRTMKRLILFSMVCLMATATQVQNDSIKNETLPEVVVNADGQIEMADKTVLLPTTLENITEALALATNYGLVLAVIPTVLTYFVTQMGNFSSQRCRITHLGSRFIWQFAYFCEPARHLRTIENHRESNSLESSAFCRKFASENFQT